MPKPSYHTKIEALNRLVADLRYDRHTDMAALTERIDTLEANVQTIQLALWEVDNTIKRIQQLMPSAGKR